MMPDNVALFATIIVVLPMFYFLLAAPAFLLVKLDIPQVAQLLRAMFSGYFLTLAYAGAIGAIAVALAGRLVLALGIGLIAAFAASSRAVQPPMTRLFTTNVRESVPAGVMQSNWSTVVCMV